MCKQVRRAHEIHELLINQPTAEFVERLDLDEQQMVLRFTRDRVLTPTNHRRQRDATNKQQ